MMLHVKRQA